MELVAPVPSKAAKKAEERKKFAAAKQQQQQLQQQQQMQQQQQQQRRYSQGSGNNTNQNQAAPMPRRKIGVFGNPKFSPIVEEQNMRAEGLNPNSQSYPQQQRKNSRPNQQQNGSGSNGSNSSDAAGISAWMTRRISGGQLEFSRSGTASLFIYWLPKLLYKNKLQHVIILLKIYRLDPPSQCNSPTPRAGGRQGIPALGQN